MPVHVELTEFCQDFTSALRPLSQSLDASIVALHELEPQQALGGVLSAFVDIQHRLKILTDKAEQQHAYLLIFGPLKSGKSTLMNAISGAYVSEVSSLPAYPCLVYVHEGEPRRLSVTRFDGSREEFASEDALHEQIEQAHAELAEELRKADREDRTFNPAIDYPRAIRRIDYVMPAPNLRQSGTILVDTPGLYTKMRYNYEQLTRDFRHNAACAVFVVKTDNLFFDQVFDEFKDLLGVFSRVFLVVNIDSTKQDLAPRGDLRPALESREPRRIIQAFEEFTASAQLREAISNGQLRIYLVDLLETARRSLAGENMLPDAAPTTGDEDTETGDETDAAGADEGETSGEDPAAMPAPPEEAAGALLGTPDEDTGEPVETEAHPRSEIGFEAFLDDLTRYLNSSDYIVEFMADSLRQGETLINEIQDEMGSTAVDRFRSEIEQTRHEADAVEEQLGRVEALQQTDWASAARELENELDAERKDFAGNELQALRKRLENQVTQWFENDKSLHSLVRERLQPEIEATDAKLQGQIDDLARTRFGQRNSGLKLDAQTVGHLHKLDLSLDRLFEDFNRKLESEDNGSNRLGPIDLHQEEMPVKKRWVDWITFRRPRSIRRGLFGEEAPSQRTIAVSTKEKRLGEPARQHLFEQVDRHVQKDLQDRDRAKLASTVQSYGDFLEEAIQRRLEETRQTLTSRRDTLQRRYESGRRVLGELESLNSASGDTLDRAAHLHARFVGERAPLTAGTESAGEEPVPSPEDPEAVGANATIGLEMDDLGTEEVDAGDFEAPPENTDEFGGVAESAPAESSEDGDDERERFS